MYRKISQTQNAEINAKQTNESREKNRIGQTNNVHYCVMNTTISVAQRVATN